MRKRLSGVVVGLVFAFALAPEVLAAATPAASSPGQGLEISPPVVELSADPGQTIATKIQIRDVSPGELVAKGEADDFGAGSGEDGKPQLLLNETGATRFSLKYWVASVPDLDLRPQQLGTVSITVNVPANAEPGGHYGVIRFTAAPPNLQGTGVALSASIGALILLRVNGNVTDRVNLAQFSANAPVDPNQTETTVAPKSFFESGPVGFTVRVQDAGTVHEVVQGTVTIKNTFGHKVAVLPVNAQGGNVLPNSVRRFDEALGQKHLFGRYTATLQMSYLGGQKTISSTLTFWVVPWKLVLLWLVGLVVLGVLLWWGIKKYNAHIIAQAKK